jgi:hypothetical protein
MLEEPDFQNSSKTINKKKTHDYNTNGHFKIDEASFPFSLRFAKKPATPVAKV